MGDYKVGAEVRKTLELRQKTGFFRQFMSGTGIDVGYRGYEKNIIPVVPNAIGVETDYPGYDGKTLPFDEGSLDFVHSSHTLEHIPRENVVAILKDWHRVLKVGGHMVLTVPHQFLYEKRKARPSRWNADHRIFYTPSILLRDIETALKPNTYRVRLLRDNDQGYDYSIPPAKHAGGCYEIECVIQKITEPKWELE